MANHTRRSFLKTTTLTAAALTMNASSFARIVGANDRVRVGIVGFSDRCRESLLPAFKAHAGEFNFDIVAVSDIWKQRREAGVAHLQKLLNHDIAPARNNEELYDRKDVDTVIIATADF